MKQWLDEKGKRIKNLLPCEKEKNGATIKRGKKNVNLGRQHSSCAKGGMVKTNDQEEISQSDSFWGKGERSTGIKREDIQRRKGKLGVEGKYIAICTEGKHRDCGTKRFTKYGPPTKET